MRNYRLIFAFVFVLYPTEVSSGFDQNSLEELFGSTPMSVVQQLMVWAKVKPGDVFIDLGSGDGRVVIAAAQRGARAIGVDLDPQRISEARAQAFWVGGVTVEWREQDFYLTDIHDATIIYLFISPRVNSKLIPKFKRELKSGTRIYAYYHAMGDEWKPEAQILAKDHELEPHYLYRWTMS